MGMGGRPGPSVSPSPRWLSAATTPSAAARPNTDPPERLIAWTRPTRFSRPSTSISRVAGPPPRTSAAATHAPSQAITVTPVAARASVA